MARVRSIASGQNPVVTPASGGGSDRSCQAERKISLSESTAMSARTPSQRPATERRTSFIAACTAGIR